MAYNEVIPVGTYGTCHKLLQWQKLWREDFREFRRIHENLLLSLPHP
ncbi:hypothetical protein FF011L_35850 [Roseimaritima multifibrata]|uniref:Uncharacterized protein n=1 Tax=Roseimaritima multifibrata TaxID=1930274 RepID=A0A517MIU0_9BACT|nr:hypothetical protein FF011L_35850 [Roseimaritima multifibrata]